MIGNLLSGGVTLRLRASARKAPPDSPGVIVILNLTSGTGRGQQVGPAEVEAAFRKHGIDAQIWSVDAGHDLGSLARKARASDDEVIVAGGGDGTISAVAGALVGTPKRLGVLPLGTLN